MKKLTALALTLAMSLSLLAGCTTNETTPTPTPATAESSLGEAVSYIRAMYKDKAGKVLRDFDVTSVVKIGEFSYDIEWTTDATEENVKIGDPADNKVAIDINENPGEEDLVFTLTATLKAGDKSESTSFEFYVPGTPAKSGGPAFVEAPEVGGTYKYALTQAELGKVLYFDGTMNGSYLATTEDPTKAVDVTIEEAEGGVYLSFEGSEGKQYIDIHVNDEGKVRVRLTAEPGVVFTWNEECKVFTANVDGADRYLGTYNTYNTISPSEIKYIAGDNASKVGISQFPCGFGTVAYVFNAAEGQPAAGTYKFALEQAELGKTLFFDGTMNGSYLATTENAGAAADVTIEEVEGGFRFSFVGAEGKQYIDIHVNDEGKTRVRLTAEPTATFVWNEECGVFTANVGDADNYLGTYNTYNTISPSAIKYIAGDNLSKIGVSQFPCFFGTAAPAM